MKKLLPILLILFTAIACSPQDKFSKEFQAIMENMEARDVLADLVRLDNKYPNKLITKINIASIYIDRGEPEKAQFYLDKGMTAAQKSKDKADKYIFYSNYSDYLFLKSDYTQSLSLAKLALSNDSSDPAGISLTIAQILINEGKYSEASSYFKQAWNNNVALFTADDLTAFYNVLGISQDAENNVPLMVSIFDELKARNPSTPGYGLSQAELLSAAGFKVSAAVALVSEIDDARRINNISKADTLKTVDIIIQSNQNETEALKIFKGYRYFIEEDWLNAEGMIASAAPEVSIAFYNYIRIASLIESGVTANEVLTSYLVLSRYYSNNQNYYYHLWKGMVKNLSAFDKEEVASVLKNCILLGPQTDIAVLSRIQLGKLYGINNGEKILLVDEVYYHVAAILEGSPLQTLEPVAIMLEMEDNEFVKDAVALLKEAAKNQLISDWLKKRAESGNMLLKERVSFITS